MLCWCSDGAVVVYRDPVPCWGQEGRCGVPSVGRDADGCEHADGDRLMLVACAMSCYSMYNSTRKGTLGGVVHRPWGGTPLVVDMLTAIG